MLSANKDVFVSPFPISMPFIAFLIALTRTFRKMLSQSGESRRPYLLVLGEKCLLFHIKYNISYWSFLHLLSSLGFPPLFLLFFIMNKYWILNAFSVSINMVLQIFFFSPFPKCDGLHL